MHQIVPTAELYQTSCEAVNRRPERCTGSPRSSPPWCGVFGIMSACLALGGCAATPTHMAGGHLIAVRYDVEARSVDVGEPMRWESLRTDLTAIANLGFDTVVLRHLDEEERRDVLNAVAAAGLTAAVALRDFDYFVLTGRDPAGGGRADHLVRRVAGELIAHPALRTLVVAGGWTSRSAARANSLCEAARRPGLPCHALDETGLFYGNEWGDRAPGRSGPATVDTGGLEDGLPGSPLERLLAQYHAGLAAGRTGGLVVDRYRRPPGDRAGVIPEGTAVSPARKAAIAGLIGHARRWGPRLFNLTKVELGDAVGGSPALRVTGLGSGRRVYVLVSNPASDRYARGDVVLTTPVGGVSASRAVEVPSRGDGAAGRVIRAHRGRITIPISLRPGDAALFEIF